MQWVPSRLPCYVFFVELGDQLLSALVFILPLSRREKKCAAQLKRLHDLSCSFSPRLMFRFAPSLMRGLAKLAPHGHGTVQDEMSASLLFMLTFKVFFILIIWLTFRLQAAFYLFCDVSGNVPATMSWLEGSSIFDHWSRPVGALLASLERSRRQISRKLTNQLCMDIWMMSDSQCPFVQEKMSPFPRFYSIFISL